MAGRSAPALQDEAGSPRYDPLDRLAASTSIGQSMKEAREAVSTELMEMRNLLTQFASEEYTAKVQIEVDDMQLKDWMDRNATDTEGKVP